MTDFTAAPWPELLGDPGEFCGYTHDDHVHDGVPLKCRRAAGHPGDAPARDMHLGATADGEPVFFGEPLVFDPVDDGIMP